MEIIPRLWFDPSAGGLTSCSGQGRAIVSIRMAGAEKGWKITLRRGWFTMAPHFGELPDPVAGQDGGPGGLLLSGYALCGTMFVDMVQAGRIERCEEPAQRPVFGEPDGVAHVRFEVRPDLPEEVARRPLPVAAATTPGTVLQRDTPPDAAGLKSTWRSGIKPVSWCRLRNCSTLSATRPCIIFCRRASTCPPWTLRPTCASSPGWRC